MKSKLLPPDKCLLGVHCPCRTMRVARLRQVFHHMLTGESEKQVAASLGISVNTLHHRAQDVYRCLGVAGRIELLSEMLRRLSDGSRRLADAAASTGRRKTGRKIRLSRRA